MAEVRPLVLRFPQGILRNLAGIVGTLLLVLPGGAGANPTESNLPLPLRAGFPSYAFAGMEPNSAKNTASTYLRMLTEGLGMSYSSRIYPDRVSLKQDVENQRLDFVLVSSMDLLRGQLVPGFEPVLAPLTGGKPGQKFLILVHQHAGFQSISDLENRHLLVFSDSDAGLEDAWLNRELARRNLPPARDFFRQIERPLSAPRAVLPVFFRRADACIIPASLLDVVASSNPQIKARLLPLAQSERFLTTVLCLRQDFPAAARRKLVDAAEQISQHPESRQFLTLSKVGQVSRFKEPMLDSVRALLADSPALSPSARKLAEAPGSPVAAPQPVAPPDQAAAGMTEPPSLVPDVTD